MIKQWMRWEPISGLTAHYILGAVTDTKQALIFTLLNVDNQASKATITFDKTAYAYSITESPNLEKTLDKLAEQHGRELVQEWFFLKLFIHR